MNPDKQARDDGAVKILAYLFKQMCAEDEELANADESLRRQVSVAFFAEWLQQNIDLKNGVEVCGELGVPQEAWHFVAQVAHSGNYVTIMNVWPRVVLGEGAPPKNPVRSFHLLTLVEWDDGRMLPLSVFTPKEFAPNATLTDGIVASMLGQQVQAAVKQVMEQGLDGLHEHTSDSYGGEHPFNVLMGAMLKVIPQLDPKLQPYLHKYMRLFQGLVRPPIPEHLKTQMEAIRRKLAVPGGGEQPRGGWDT